MIINEIEQGNVSASALSQSESELKGTPLLLKKDLFSTKKPGEVVPISSHITHRYDIRDGLQGKESDIKQCVVCLNDDSKLATIELKNCSHTFHPYCIATWMTSPIKQMGQEEALAPSCPMCRSTIEIKQNQALKEYEEVLNIFKMLLKNHNKWYPYMEDLITEAAPNPQIAPFLGTSGTILKTFWTSNDNAVGLMLYIANSKKLIVKILTEVEHILDDVEGKFSSQDEEKKVRALTELFKIFNQQARDLLEIYEKISPPFKVEAQEQLVITDDTSKPAVRWDDFISAHEKINKKLDQLELGRCFEVLYAFSSDKPACAGAKSQSD